MLKPRDLGRGTLNKVLGALILVIYLAIWHEGDEDLLNHLSLISAISSEDSEVRGGALVLHILSLYRKTSISHKQ